MTSPQITLEEVKKILAANGCDLTKVCWLAIRGYFLDSVGVKGKNDRGVWDDAWVIYSPTHGIKTFRANVDPTRYRKGRGTGDEKGMASLASGVWLYGKGLHKGRKAFRQCAKVLAFRDGYDGPYKDWGWHAQDIHDAMGSTTSSAGCQTLPTDEFKPLRDTVVKWLDEAENDYGVNDWGERVRVFEYVLIEETERRKGNIIATYRWDSKS